MAMPDVITDMGSLNANGSTAAIMMPGSGTYGFAVSGTIVLGSAKLEVSFSDSGTDWFEVPNAVWTAAGFKQASVSGRRMRFTVAGVTSVNMQFKLAVPVMLA
jgi:hypothetical protein